MDISYFQEHLQPYETHTMFHEAGHALALLFVGTEYLDAVEFRPAGAPHLLAWCKANPDLLADLRPEDYGVFMAAGYAAERAIGHLTGRPVQSTSTMFRDDIEGMEALEGDPHELLRMYAELFDERLARRGGPDLLKMAAMRLSESYLEFDDRVSGEAILKVIQGHLLPDV